MKRKRKRIILVVAAFVLVAAVVLSTLALRAARRASYPLVYMDEVTAAAEKYDLPVSLVMGVIHTESSFNENAVSPAGAMGLMQIMPDTGAWLASKVNVNGYEMSLLLDPVVNIEMGCWYLNYLYETFDGDMNAVLAGYNTGQNRVRKWLLDDSYTNEDGKLVIIPIEEAKDYVEKVLYAQGNYQEIYKMD